MPSILMTVAQICKVNELTAEHDPESFWDKSELAAVNEGLNVHILNSRWMKGYDEDTERESMRPHTFLLSSDHEGLLNFMRAVCDSGIDDAFRSDQSGFAGYCNLSENLLAPQQEGSEFRTHKNAGSMHLNAYIRLLIISTFRAMRRQGDMFRKHLFDLLFKTDIKWLARAMVFACWRDRKGSTGALQRIKQTEHSANYAKHKGHLSVEKSHVGMLWILRAKGDANKEFHEVVVRLCGLMSEYHSYGLKLGPFLSNGRRFSVNTLGESLTDLSNARIDPGKAKQEATNMYVKMAEYERTQREQRNAPQAGKRTTTEKGRKGKAKKGK